jgi:chemotaxis protein CheD
MSSIVVGMADCRLSDDADAVLVTYALGSCIGLAIHDPVARVGGLLHFMLPESCLDPEKAEANPWMFADTAIPLLFRSAYELGADKKRLKVRAAGASHALDETLAFNIGKRNYWAMRKILSRAGVRMHAQAVGGGNCRTVRLEVGTGALWVHTAGIRDRELVLPGEALLSERRRSAIFSGKPVST